MSMIKCPECGKEISDKANSCPNCGCPRNQFFESENKTKNQEIYCPICHSRYIGIQGDIPLHKKIFEIGAFGNVTCITKSEYEKGMTFYCKKCGTIWDNKGIIKKGEKKEYAPGFSLPIISGILSLFYFFMIFFVIPAPTNDILAIISLIISVILLVGGILCFAAIFKNDLCKISLILFYINAVIILVLFISGHTTIFAFIYSLIIVALNKYYKLKIS